MVEWRLGDPVPEKSEGEIHARFARRMRRAREERGLSQREAAEGVGVSQQALSKLEGKGEASEETLGALWSLYGLRWSYPSAPLDPVRRKRWFEGYRLRVPAVAVEAEG